MRYKLLLLFILLSVLQSYSGQSNKKYNLTEQTLSQLYSFKAEKKFSAKTWKARGLVPSPKDIVMNMDQAVNTAVDEIIDSRQNLDEEKIRFIIKKNLQGTSNLDTEEREFLAETFYALSSILKVDIKDILNSYLYSFG